jgi:hypothetical protein
MRDVIVLIDAIATDPKSADQFPVCTKRFGPREQHDAALILRDIRAWWSGTIPNEKKVREGRVEVRTLRVESYMIGQWSSFRLWLCPL